jgi:hypothetical protein
MKCAREGLGSFLPEREKQGKRIAPISETGFSRKIPVYIEVIALLEQ